MGNRMETIRGKERVERQDKILHTCCLLQPYHTSSGGTIQLLHTESIQSAINVLVSQYKTFAGNDGSSNTLNIREFSSLVASQLPTFVKNASDPRRDRAAHGLVG